MFLDRISGENFTGSDGVSRPLIVTRDSPRKAFFKKLNRHGEVKSGLKKIKRRSGLMRGNSFAGLASAQRVVVPAWLPSPRCCVWIIARERERRPRRCCA